MLCRLLREGAVSANVTGCVGLRKGDVGVMPDLIVDGVLNLPY